MNRPRWPAQPVPHLKTKGIIILITTWVFVVISLWLFLFQENDPIPEGYRKYEQETGWPMRSYISFMGLMMCVIIWLWSLFAWLGMKFFRHANGLEVTEKSI